MDDSKVLGIDVGASGMKGAIVDVKSGELLTERVRLDTPQPSSPQAMADIFRTLVRMHNWSGIVGCGFPAIVKKGVAYSAANIDKAWQGTNVEKIFSRASNCPVHALNDADAAGIAEMQFGLGKGKEGVVLLITIGSGLGSALFVDGILVPNTELGHLYLNDQLAEHYASNQTRKDQNLSWEEWGKRFNEYLYHIERLFSPDHIIIGGGVSKRFEDYSIYLDVLTPVSPALLYNNAGAVGAAYYAYSMEKNATPTGRINR
jgi:polyphosphate glucokinase